MKSINLTPETEKQYGDMDTVRFDPLTKYIVRTNRAGVFFGNIAEYNFDTRTIHMVDVRRLWYWDGACSLSELATLGMTAPRNCKFTVSVPAMIICEVIEIIPCSDTAAKQIEGIEAWMRH